MNSTYNLGTLITAIRSYHNKDIKVKYNQL